MAQRPIINILTPGRFHVCDLARELIACGYDVRFYSIVPPWKIKQFGLQAKNSRSLFVFLAPFVFLEQRGLCFRGFWAACRRWILDRLFASIMRPCDIVIAMSGEFNYSLKKAKKRGNIIVVERGSKHILDQKRILDSNPFCKTTQVTEANVKRELLSYELSDYISIASKHVKQSFLTRGFPEEKLFLNPYGVDLHDFHPVPNSSPKYDFIMVGTWGFQKGCDLIVEAISNSSFSFLHVGALGDLPFPEGNKQFVHIPPVSQKKLINYYSMAKVFLLPTRQDGFAMVLAQALACNLPIIASRDCSAEDLKGMAKSPQYIGIIEEYSSDSIIKQMNEMMAKWEQMNEEVYAGESLKSLTWESYGKRFDQFLQSIVK